MQAQKPGAKRKADDRRRPEEEGKAPEEVCTPLPDAATLRFTALARLMSHLT